MSFARPQAMSRTTLEPRPWDATVYAVLTAAAIVVWVVVLPLELVAGLS